MRTLKKDNSTFDKKVADRMRVLARMSSTPVVMETHGGYGKLFKSCYRSLAEGCVFETDQKKADTLSDQRPTWRVYNSDCVAAIAAGIASDMPFSLLDCDPYGEPWPVIDAFLESRKVVPELWIVVNDGLRQKVKVGGAWNVNSLKAIVEKRGADIYETYLEVCEAMLDEKAAKAGYVLDRFSGYYCGDKKGMTHYAARLVAA